MAKYTITIFTGDHPNAGTINEIFLKLVGGNGKSKEDLFPGHKIKRKSQCTHTLECSKSLGELVAVKLRIQKKILRNLDWFVDKMEVTSPDGKVYKFPIYRWVKYEKNSDGDEDNQHYCFREGTAMSAFEEVNDIDCTRKNE